MNEHEQQLKTMFEEIEHIQRNIEHLKKQLYLVKRNYILKVWNVKVGQEILVQISKQPQFAIVSAEQDSFICSICDIPSLKINLVKANNEISKSNRFLTKKEQLINNTV